MATVKTVWNRAQEEYEAAQSARREYAPGERVTQLAEQLESYAAATPQAYQSPYQQQIAELAGRIADRTFSYDLLSDPVYRQYRSQYQRLGRRAMEDTVGAASALTGGYGSSYAVTAGQQAYDGQLARLNDLVPRLYDSAFTRFLAEGEGLQTQLDGLLDREDSAYAAHRDAVADWQKGYDDLYARYADEADRDVRLWQQQQELTARRMSQAYEMLLDSYAAETKGSSGSSGGKSEGKKGKPMDYSAAYKQVMDQAQTYGTASGIAAAQRLYASGSVDEAAYAKLLDAMQRLRQKSSVSASSGGGGGKNLREAR